MLFARLVFKQNDKIERKNTMHTFRFISLSHTFIGTKFKSLKLVSFEEVMFFSPQLLICFYGNFMNKVSQT